MAVIDQDRVDDRHPAAYRACSGCEMVIEPRGECGRPEADRPLAAQYRAAFAGKQRQRVLQRKYIQRRTQDRAEARIAREVERRVQAGERAEAAQRSIRQALALRPDTAADDDPIRMVAQRSNRMLNQGLALHPCQRLVAAEAARPAAGEKRA
jgi:hypothetical protein